MKRVKCEACGAPFDVKGQSEKCPYCGTVYREEVKEVVADTAPSTTIINNYYGNTDTLPNKSGYDAVPQGLSQSDLDLYYSPRPKIRLIPAIIGFCFYFFPGLIYVFYKAVKQARWDALHGKR